MRACSNKIPWSLWLPVVLVALIWPTRMPAASPTAQTHANAADDAAFRPALQLDAGWKFKRQANPRRALEAEFIGAERPDYDDSHWLDVSLPHTWDATPLNPFAPPGHFRGIGYYRRRLEIPANWRGRRVLLQFKGVFQIANVWLNGQHIGNHVGGFTGFEFDITPALRWPGPNTLAVRVDDTLDSNIAPANETNVTVYGGMYRRVRIVAVDPLYVRTNGTLIRTEASNSVPIVRASTWVRNSTASPQSARLISEVIDPSGVVVARMQASANVTPGQEYEFDQATSAIPGARLWSPDAPNLYRLISHVFAGSRETDRLVTLFGIRFMGYDPASGFTLNGQPLRIHGINRRQDYGFLGDAVPESITRRDIRMIKDTGANFLRTSHYPQDPVVLEECDRLGILVWEEVPNIKIFMDPPSAEDTEYHHTVRFPRALVANIKQQLREMIERDRNHPSIIIWGLADDLSGYPFAEDFVELSDAAHALDPTRWTAGRAPHVTDIIDATSTPGLVAEHARHPERKYIWNEWGAFPAERGREGPAWVEHKPVNPEDEASLSDSEAALLMEGYLMQWNALPWLGTSKWCMFDPGSVNSTRAQPLYSHQRDKVQLRWNFDDYRGVADFWRLPKNGFYFLQSQWSSKPMVHIAGQWTASSSRVPNNAARSVRVYSNCESVELLLDGRSLGTQRPASAARVWHDFRTAEDEFEYRDEFNQQPLPGAGLAHPPFIFDGVNYAPGTLAAVGHCGATTVRDELRTSGPAASVRLLSESRSIAADGEDTTRVLAEVVDRQGVVVPEARNWIQFAITGPGRLLGGATEIDAISGIVAINVQSTGGAGRITVRASSAALGSANLDIEAR